MKNLSLRLPFATGLILIGLFAAAHLVRAWSEDPASLAQGGAAGDIPLAPEPDLSQYPAEQLAQWWDRAVAGPDEPVEVMIELEEPPAIEAYLRAQPDGMTAEKRSAPEAAGAARSQLARIELEQQQLAAKLAGAEFGARLTGRVQRVFNGVSVQIAARWLREIQRLPGVKAIHLLKPMYLTTETSVPFIGAPQVWQGGAGADGFTGEGVKVAVLDTGIDYVHVNFGGSGSATDYAANDQTVIGDVPGFPGVKVVGGYDFVGNAYNAASEDPNLRIPRPDPDPMDCYGHGTGTASILAGFGVTTNGLAFAGPYNLTTHANPFRIGPGVAPGATLLGYKVYGCDPRGGTNGAVVAQAIDRALDPNGDGDFADRVDVILLPFSGSFGVLPDAPEVAAINRAAQLNVVSVGAAGNGGDTYFAVGSPGGAPNAVSVAASHDNGFYVQNLQVTNPSNLAGNHSAAVSAIGPSFSVEINGNLIYASPSDGCAPLTNAGLISGNIAFIDNTGSCTRTTKVRNAQNASARAVVIGNHVDALPPTLLDDGTGSDIRIPSLLLNRTTAIAIQNTLGSATSVSVRFTPTNIAPQPGLADVLAPSNSRGGLYHTSSRGPGAAQVFFTKPDISAPGVNLRVARSGTGNEAGFFTGTSDAAPHAAGVVVITPRGANEFHGAAFWAPRSRSLKADNVLPDLADPGRAGFGQVFVKPGPRASIIRGRRFFSTYESVGSNTFNQELFQVQNTGAGASTVTVTFTRTSDIPGVDVTFPGSVTVPANGSSPFAIQVNVTPSAMKHTRGGFVSATQSGQPRHWLSEESGYFTLTPQGGGDPLRYPIHFSLRPASEMGTTQASLDLGAATGALNLNLTGVEVRTGNNFPTDEISIASALELQAISPDDPLISTSLKFADLQHIGVRSDFISKGSLASTILQFGVSTYDDWHTPNEFSARVFIDTNRDGVDDFEAFSTAFPNEQGAPGDVFFTRLRNVQTGALSSEFFLNSVTSAQYNTVPFNTNVMVLGVRASSLNLNPANARFNYRIAASYGGVVVDQSRTLSFDPTRPGLHFGSNSIFFDLNNSVIPVNYNLSDFRANGSEGALILHHHNGRGGRAQILPANLGREGDVAPRSSGDGSNSIIDWVQVGRFAAGLDSVNPGNEFQRADCAPRGSGGEGRLTVADWVQAGRYAAGLDPPAGAAGPVTPASGQPQFQSGEPSGLQRIGAGRTRTLRAVSASFIAGQTNTLEIELDARGGENAAGFSLKFDPGVLSYVSAAAGGGAPGATLVVDAMRAAGGHLGLALALPAGQGVPPGARRIAVVRFNLAAGSSAGATRVSFGDQVMLREIADSDANAVPARYAGAAVTMIRAAPRLLSRTENQSGRDRYQMSRPARRAILPLATTRVPGCPGGCETGSFRR